MDQDTVPYVDALARTRRAQAGSAHASPATRAGRAPTPRWSTRVGKRALRDRHPRAGSRASTSGPPSRRLRAGPAARRRRVGRRAHLVPRRRGVAGKPRGLPRAAPLGHAGGRCSATSTRARSTGSSSPACDPTFVAPEIDPELGSRPLPDPRRARRGARRRARRGRRAGRLADLLRRLRRLAALAEICHSRGLPLIVDEAWGAHLRFSPELPTSALECGRRPRHLLDPQDRRQPHPVGDGPPRAVTAAIDEPIVDRVVTLARVDEPELAAHALARRRAPDGGDPRPGAARRDAFDAGGRPARRSARFPASTFSTSRSSATRASPAATRCGSRSTFAALSITGHGFARSRLSTSDIDYELATETVVVAVFGMGGSAAAAGRAPARGARAGRRETLGETEQQPAVPFAVPPPWGPLEMTPATPSSAPRRPFRSTRPRAGSRAESLAAYPPGIPNVLPGESLTRETLDFIADTLAHGGKLRGASDRTLNDPVVSR